MHAGLFGNIMQNYSVDQSQASLEEVSHLGLSEISITMSYKLTNTAFGNGRREEKRRDIISSVWLYKLKEKWMSWNDDISMRPTILASA